MKNLSTLIAIIIAAFNINASAMDLSAKAFMPGGDKDSGLAEGNVELIEAEGSSEDFAKAFRIENHTGTTINYLYFSPDYEARWGTDVLGSNVFRNGYQLTVYTNDMTCFYDVKWILANGQSSQYRVNVCRYSSLVINL